MEPEISGTNPNLIFSFDEIMVFAQSKCKVVTSCEKWPFKRKEINTLRMILGLCISPFSNGPPQLFVLSCIREVSEFQGFHRDTLRVFSSQNGWMTGDLFQQMGQNFHRMVGFIPDGIAAEYSKSDSSPSD
jgi:hypothetical protein